MAQGPRDHRTICDSCDSGDSCTQLEVLFELDRQLDCQLNLQHVAR